MSDKAQNTQIDPSAQEAHRAEMRCQKLAEALARLYVGGDGFSTSGPMLTDGEKRQFTDWKSHEGQPTIEDFRAHVDGKRRLHVPPSRDGKVKFGQIDIDQKVPERDMLELCGRLKGLRVPVTVTRSKSGGAHIDVFFYQWEDGEFAGRALRGLVASLGLKDAKVEILVNTAKRLTVPYFGNEKMGCWIGPDSETGEDKLLSFAGDRDDGVFMSTSLVQHDRVAEMTTWADQVKDARSSRLRTSQASPEPTIPMDVLGRHELIKSVLASCRSLGWDRARMSEYVYAMDARKFADHPAYGSAPPLQDDHRDHGKAQIESLLDWFAARSPGSAIDPEVVAAMNEQYAYILLGDKGCILDLKAFEAADRANLFIQKGSFFDMYRGTTTLVGKKVRTTAEAWFDDPARRTYRGFTFDPSAGPEVWRGDFPARNLFSGFGLEPTPGEVDPWYRHLRLVCSGDEPAVSQITQFAADLVQNPGRRGPGIAIMLFGEEGNGKSTVGFTLRHVFGHDYSFEVQEKDELFGRFNDHLMGRPLLLVEEATFAGDPRMTARLKTLITSQVINYEGKFKGVVPMQNLHRLICSTNDRHAVSLSHNDRRWLVIHVPSLWDNMSDESVAERDAYFSAYYAWLEGEGGPALLHHLLNEIKVDRDALRTPVVTSAKIDQQVRSLTLLERFLVDAANSGTLPQDDFGTGLTAPEAIRDVLHEMQRKGGYSREKVPHFLRREIAEYLPLGLAEDDPFTWYKPGPYDEPKRARGIRFPSLAETRAALTKRLRFTDWDQGVIEWRAAKDEQVASDLDAQVEIMRRNLQKAELAAAITKDDFPM